MTKPVLSVERVSYRYGATEVLTDLSLEVHRGEFLALIGPNGSGKTTLLKLILGLLKPDAGRVCLFGEPLARMRHRERAAYVSQKSNAFNSGFPASVEEIVRSGLTKKAGILKRLPVDAEERVARALEEVGMAAFRRRAIGELSGGQQQRVFIARALAAGPELLILDEPTVGIDIEHVQAFYDLLASLNRERELTIVLVTHEVETVSKLATHVACLNRTIHFHGFTADYEAMSDEQRAAWYGHAVRRLDHGRDADV